MRCPSCGHDQSRVVDSRNAHSGSSIRRRRECEACGKRFTTYERVEESMPMIVKRDGRREPYSRKKLLHGLHLACRKRPVKTEDIEALAKRIERELARHDRGEVTSATVGDRVMDGLRGLDPVAFVRFASVYQSFDTLEAFDRFLDSLGQPDEADKADEPPEAPSGGR